MHQHLEELLQRLGVSVRTESFDPKIFGETSTCGGLCRLQGRTVVFVNARAPLIERITVLATAAACLDIEAIYVPPAVRQFIETRTPPPAPSTKKTPHLRLVSQDETNKANKNRKRRR